MVRRFWIALFALVALIGPRPASPQAGEVVRDPVAGIEVTKPASWTILTAQQHLDNFNKIPLKDSALSEYAKKNVSIPIIAFAKYPEPFDDINPSLKINLRAAGTFKGKDGIGILKILLPGMQKSMMDFDVIAGPEKVTIDRLPAGHAKISYRMTFGGTSYDIVSELWIVPRGNFFFIIGAGYRADGKTGSAKEIAAIVKTIKIARD